MARARMRLGLLGISPKLLNILLGFVPTIAKLKTTFVSVYDILTQIKAVVKVFFYFY